MSLEKWLIVIGLLEFVFAILAFFRIDVSIFKKLHIQRIEMIASEVTRREKIMAILLIGGFIFSGYGYYLSSKKTYIPARYFIKWGSSVEEVIKTRLLEATIYSSTLIDMQDKYKLALIGFQADGLVDPLDMGGFQKSNLYDIRHGLITIRISVDDKFIEGLRAGKRTTNYLLVLVPNNIGVNQFNTMREAKALGVVMLKNVSGPP